jgi:hypothetical protein
MPVSAIVIRLAPDAQPELAARELAAVAHVELGARTPNALAAVVAADTYPEHDAALDALGRSSGVCSVDIVLHDFSDVTQFDHLPRRTRSQR